MTKTTEKIETRYLIRSDVPAICRIEAASFGPDDAWREEDFVTALRERGAIGHVAIMDNRNVGYLIQRRFGDAYRILSMAVDPECRRLGVGRRLVEKVTSKIKLSGGPNRIEVGVRDRDLGTQLFFRDLKFLAVNSVRNYFSGGEDLIEFVYRVRKEPNDGDSESIRGI